ncbi:MAG: hypothetical protein E6X17_06235 [Sporomusaceae bacterium]|nr:hypothetical protein [Sporomusaceae bacterium]
MKKILMLLLLGTALTTAVFSPAYQTVVNAATAVNEPPAVNQDAYCCDETAGAAVIDPSK